MPAVRAEFCSPVARRGLRALVGFALAWPVAGCSTPFAPPPSAHLAEDAAGGGAVTEDSAVLTEEGGDSDSGAAGTVDTGEAPPEEKEPAPCRLWGSPAQAGTVGDAALNEISGLAASRRNTGMLWVLEDHAGPAAVVAIAEDGSTMGKVTLDGVQNNDWEDIAVGNCPEGTCLFVGEIGDNDHDRTWHGVYRLPEPEIPKEGGLDLTVTAELFQYAYPDGSHDAEGLAVLPDGTPVVFSKEYDTDSSTVFAFPTLDAGTTVTLDALARFATGSGAEGAAAATTAADLWDDGSRLILRTYGHIWEYELPSPDEAGLAMLDSLTPAELYTGEERQGESVAYSAEERSYYTVSEDVNPPVWATGCADGQ